MIKTNSDAQECFLGIIHGVEMGLYTAQQAVREQQALNQAAVDAGLKTFDYSEADFEGIRSRHLSELDSEDLDEFVEGLDDDPYED